MNHTDSDDIFRLYIREWIIIHTLHMKGINASALVDQAEAWIKQHLTDRVRDNDIRLNMHTDDADTFWCHVEVFKDNLKGEFKKQSAAETHAMIHHYDEYTIVARNSAADHEIRNYGVTKL